ncbi:MAG: MBL fold metallo-hydrolase [Thaumarchaeota archaeon]|jgi:predicted metallo-beta-lactamase superfamily hydrolase|nr:MBL fold metallo-hydrolase [Candidatus Wolframiiraptor allenii]
MRVKFLAFDSMGTRSMCTLVETDDARIIIDPGAALGPWRYGLKPHPIELERLREHKRAIEREASEADLIIITHYHYDHFPRPGEDIGWLRGKRILLKDPEHMINFSQRTRAGIFLERLRRLDARVEVADSRELRIGGCRVRFSSPVEHGDDPRLGYVVEVLIVDRGEKLIHSSDVEGFVSRDQVKFILDNRPDILVCDGPMTYMLGYRLGDNVFRESIRNMSEIIGGGFLQEMILDHHLLRDLEWRDRVRPVMDWADTCGVRVRTAAAYMGFNENLLEANRKKLYEELGGKE